MKKSLGALFFATAVAVSLVACKEEKREKLNKHDRNKKVNVTSTDKAGKRMTVEVNEKMTAEKLLEAGEVLMTSGTFNLADIAFELALKKDPKNEKALFYRSFLKRFMVLKGVLKRIRPLANEVGGIAALDRVVDKSKDYPGNNYLLGIDDNTIQEDIKTGANLESVIAEYAKAVADFHNHLLEMRRNRGKGLVLNTSVDLIRNRSRMGNDRCIYSTEKKETKNFKITCTFLPVTAVKMTESDLIALSQIVAGERLFLGVLSNYSIDGMEKLKNIGGLMKMSARELQNEIKKVETIGKGKNKSEGIVKGIESLGADAIVAFGYMQKHAKELCPQDKLARDSRKGHYFSKGICVAKNDITRNLSILGEALKGVVDADILIQKEAVSTKIDLLALAKNPVDHLNKLAPVEYQNCKTKKGTVEIPKSLQDNTFGGVLVDGTAADLLAKECGVDSASH